jgi:hypothetical protein
MADRIWPCLALSVLIHAAIVWPRHQNETGAYEPKSEQIQVQLLPKSTEDRRLTVVPGDGTQSAGQEHCSADGKNYRGVGFTWYEATGQIVEVAEGYPAAKAGVLPGDRVVSKFNVTNETASFIVDRQGELITFNIKTEDICFKEQSPTQEANANP